jgi:hypothetical protein
MELNQKYIQIYNSQLESLKNNALLLDSFDQIQELFKEVVILFINKLLYLFNKITSKESTLLDTSIAKKISHMNTLLQSLEGDCKLFGMDILDYIQRGYINYVYLKYRDHLLSWDFKSINNVGRDQLENAILQTATKEQLDIMNYMDLLPELLKMLSYLDNKDVHELLYLLNNINVIIDVIIYKKYINN